MKIYPNGIYNPGKLSVYLNCGAIKEEIDGLPFRVNITNDLGVSVVSQSNKLDYGDTSLFGWKSLINNAVLPNRFKIRLTVSRTKMVAKPNFSLVLNNRFVQLLDSGEYADVEFEISNDGGKPLILPAHRLVLTSISPVFKTMFNGPFKDSDSKVIKIENVQPEVFKIFLEILYGKQIEFDEHFAPIALHLLSLASKYGIRELGESIVECLEYNLSPDTAIDALCCADRFQQEYVDLKPSVLDYICENLKNVLLSDGYRNLLSDNNNMKLVSEITMAMAGIKHSDDHLNEMNGGIKNNEKTKNESGNSSSSSSRSSSSSSSRKRGRGIP